MTLRIARSRLPILLLPLVALATGGCSGDPFVEFNDAAVVNGGSAPVSSGGSGDQPSGGVNVVAASGSATGGTAPIIPPGAAGADSGAAGDGSAGIIGVAGAPSQPLPEVFDLIDDVEGPFPKLPAVDGRNGGWFTVHDDSYGQVTGATATALQPARGSSHFAAGISGGGFTDWGAQLGVSLKSPASGYDASKHCGLRFLAKGAGSGWTLLVSDRLSVPQGGVCVQGSWDPAQGCFHYVGKTFSVTSEWQEIKLRFDELALLQDPASPRKLDPSALYDIVFNFQNAEGAAFQLLVDDLAFIDKASPECQ
jgi:hypothetical protein